MNYQEIRRTIQSMIALSSAHSVAVLQNSRAKGWRWAISGKTTSVCRTIRHVGVKNCLIAIAHNPSLKLSDLKQVAGLSSRGLHKAFLTQVGFNPGKILRLARLQFSCELLRTTGLKIETVALRCGYQDSNGLCVAFRRDLKMTPTEFRNHYRLRLASEEKAWILCAIRSQRENSRLTLVLP
jgi:AraC-like DNA-binding protein